MVSPVVVLVDLAAVPVGVPFDPHKTSPDLKLTPNWLSLAGNNT